MSDTDAAPWHPWHPWVVPGALAALVAALLLVTPRYAVGAGFAGVVDPLFWPVAGVCSVVAVALGRRWPVPATALALLPFLALPWIGVFVWAWLLALIAIAVGAALDGQRRAVVPLTAATLVVVLYCASEMAALLPIGPVTAGGPGFQTVTFGLYVAFMTAAVGVAASVGASARARRRETGARAQERRAVEVETLAGERARLARDLHDVVAHHVSLVVVRAESAPYQYPDLDDRARGVLAAVAGDARQALGELRQVLTVLQRTEEGHSGAAASRAPQPGADDVVRLVAQARAAGQDVTVTGAWGDVPPAQGYVLYRAAQEGLTNARRHAPGHSATLELRRESADDGTIRVGFRLTNPLDRARDAGPARGVQAGRGLVGMRERVVALGGAVDARTGEAAFVLDVTLPVPSVPSVPSVPAGAPTPGAGA